jgi:hypothetical protein
MSAQQRQGHLQSKAWLAHAGVAQTLVQVTDLAALSQILTLKRPCHASVVKMHLLQPARDVL